MDKELEHKMMDGYDKMNIEHLKAIDGARKALSGACETCWFRLHEKCEGSKCAIHRMSEAIEKFNKSRNLGHLDNWNWYLEAKQNNHYLFI